ncbi:YbaK/EbsC family protein [Halobacteria archaeon AArc-curdl1]|uniref:YbaK/EbsC family protein n=1 Tax=Natronosalvus hydrolyticus TaxID=2979988 RepID=A0AAP3E4P5_9EURY|nr:YbaK/EbsC family protein [Halobacteria archaeon AArc-curdl1]
MHPRATAFVECAREEYGFEPAVKEFPEGTKTAADAAEAIGCDVAQIASSLAFEADGDLIVSVTSGAHRADEATLAEHLDVSPDSLEMAAPDRIKSQLGWSIGGVPPFCHETPTPTFLDRTLLKFDTVWAAAGTPTAVFPIEPAVLQRLADADVVRVAAPE